MSAPLQAAANIQRKYPNGTLATGAGTTATIIIWAATTAGLDMDATVGAAFATVFAGAASFVGRRGLQGCWKAIWQGADYDGE